MSYEGQAHHPHPPNLGRPPNAHLVPDAGNGQPYVPPGLELVQAHWFIRHGERAPVRQRLVGQGEIPPVFSLCSVGRDFRTAVLTLDAPSAPTPLAKGALTTEQSTMEVRRMTEDVGSSARGYVGGLSDCYWGQLTDLGRRSTLDMGKRLRDLYVPLGFLPANLTSNTSAQVAFRSTNMPRTIESLHQLIEGLWPSRAREEGLKVEFKLRGWMDEDLYPNASCGRLRKLDAASIANAAREHNPSLEQLDAKLIPIIGGPLRIDSSPRASGILDTVLAAKAHGFKMSPELDDPKTLRTLEDAVVHEWFDGYMNLEFRKLAMGRLLSSVRQTLEAKIADPREEREKTRLHVYSCHDTSVAGILNALDAFDKRWPPFTSHVAIELFRSSASPASASLLSFLPSFLRPTPAAPHFLRLRYNGRTLRLPACAPEGKHLPGSNGEVCTFEALRDAVAKAEVQQDEWRRMCGNKAE
ncbi:uncharacterized protein JCM10292_005648 [Rhodotorula paludigena]|uniref:uncharacterized protein n=1 Tax=Rhodotorula paludigena TaxID=86838 RepID=UPI00316DE1A0